MAMRTTQKDIRDLNAISIAHYRFNQIQELVEAENGLNIIAYSYGQNGANGAVFQGCNTGALYKIGKRCTALAQLY